MGSSGSRPEAPDDGGQSQSRKSKENILIPFLRSLSCGASSSHRSDNSMQVNQTTSGDILVCQIPSQKAIAFDGQPGHFQSQKATAFDGQSSHLQSQSMGGDCGSKGAESGYGLTVSQQDSEITSNSETGESISSCHGIGDGSCLVAGASCSLLSQQSQNRDQHQAGSHRNGIPRFRRPFTTCTPAQEPFSSADVSHNPLSEQQTLEAHPGFSLGSSLRVEDTSGDVSEVETSADPAEWGVSSRQGSGMDIEAAGVASSQQDMLSIHQENDLGVLHVEALSLVAQTLDESSSLLRGESSGREARRNNRRRLWDALTRASSHRRRLFLQPTEDNDNTNTWNDDWELFDWNSSEEMNRANEGGMLMRRSSDREGRRWRSRPEVWDLQQFSNSTGGSSGRSSHCAFGRHPSGHCSCEAFVMTEETSTRESISRIVMLAEALFGVLDEIHRQSVALSRSTSLSLVSLPAPEAVVDSFAIKIHKRADKSDCVLGQCAECYICLVDYEEGDQIRVLPCAHEFHMLCVDKWLKEVHRVCPLCRGNVCGGKVLSSRATVA